MSREVLRPPTPGILPGASLKAASVRPFTRLHTYRTALRHSTVLAVSRPWQVVLGHTGRFELP